MKLKSRQKTVIALALSMVLAFSLSACGSSGDSDTGGGDKGKTISIHLGTNFGTACPAYPVMQDFAAELKEKSGGSMELVLDIAGVHGSDRDIIEMVENGTLGMGYIADIGVVAVIPEIGYVNLPYLFPSIDDVEELYYHGWIGDAYRATLKKHGIEVMGEMMENDFRWMTNSKHAIDTVDSLKGLKMRVPENPMYVSFFEKIGTQPTAMAVSELGSALQQGVVDGQDNGPLNTFSYGFYEFQPYMTRSNHAFAGIAYLASEKFMKDNLDEEQEALFRELCDKYSQLSKDAMRQGIKEYEQKMIDAGVEIIDVSPELDKLFREKAHEIWMDDSVVGQFDPDVMKRIREELMK